MRSTILFERAIDHLQTPEVARRLAGLVILHLEKIDGFDSLPTPLRQAIEQCAAQLYSAGFVQGARWNGDAE